MYVSNDTWDITYNWKNISFYFRFLPVVLNKLRLEIQYKRTVHDCKTHYKTKKSESWSKD